MPPEPANNAQVTFHTWHRFRQTMLCLDSLGTSNVRQGLVALGIAVIGCVLHRLLPVSRTDYGKHEPRTCRIPSAFAAHFADRLSIIGLWKALHKAVDLPLSHCPERLPYSVSCRCEPPPARPLREARRHPSCLPQPHLCRDRLAIHTTVLLEAFSPCR